MVVRKDWIPFCANSVPVLRAYLTKSGLGRRASVLLGLVAGCFRLFESRARFGDMRMYSTLFVGLLILASCNPAGESSQASSSNCANGFAPTGNPVTMGTESGVDLVKAIDAEWAKMDLEAMRKFYSDTCVFEWNDGDQFQGFDAFAAKLAKDTLDYAWNMMWAFSVDDDANAAGEWVHAGFDEVGTLQGDTVEKAVIEEWYLVQDDKVQYYSNSKRLKP